MEKNLGDILKKSIDVVTEKKYFDYIDSIMLKLKELYKSDDTQRYISDILDRKYN